MPRSPAAIVAGVDTREERITLETDRYRITGNITLPRDGYRSRMTDFLNAAEQGFLALTDVEMAPLDGSTVPSSRPFMAVAIRHVVVAAPAEAAPGG